VKVKSSYAYILAPVLGYVVAQGLKYLLPVTGVRSWRIMYRSGSMPSSHSAVVTALAAVILFNEGVSDLFAVAVTLTMLTTYDAVMARRSIGEQGTALLRLIASSPFAKDPLPRVALGHKPLEVAAGMAVGMIVGYFVAFLITK
jgi:acid phosphatase family membrane protein YuiD